MNAAEVLAAIRRHHRKYPVLHELVLTDHERGRREPRKRRIDALLVGPGGVRTAIEIKTSVADFRRETEAKRRPWIQCCSRFVYATPRGLLDPADIPLGIGLWEVDDRFSSSVAPTLTVAKRCAVNPNPLPVPDQLFAALAYRLEKPRR